MKKKMKSQRLGLVLGMNVAVACLVMQGCKVTRPGEDNLPPPALDPAVASSTTTTVVEPVETVPAPEPKTSSTISVSAEPETAKPQPPPAPRRGSSARRQSSRRAICSCHRQKESCSQKMPQKPKIKHPKG